MYQLQFLNRWMTTFETGCYVRWRDQSYRIHEYIGSHRKNFLDTRAFEDEIKHDSKSRWQIFLESIRPIYIGVGPFLVGTVWATSTFAAELFTKIFRKLKNTFLTFVDNISYLLYTLWNSLLIWH